MKKIYYLYNIKKIEGLDLILDNSEESVSFSNREAVVVETPIMYNGPVEKGDTLLVHSGLLHSGSTPR